MKSKLPKPEEDKPQRICPVTEAVYFVHQVQNHWPTFSLLLSFLNLQLSYLNSKDDIYRQIDISA